MNTKSILDRVRARKRRLQRRLDRDNYPEGDRPVMRASNIHYELAERALATPYGGIGLMLQLARESGLIEAIDRRLHLLRAHLPYHESDHVLNIGFNALCDGTCMQDLELRRQDEAYLNAWALSGFLTPLPRVISRAGSKRLTSTLCMMLVTRHD